MSTNDQSDLTLLIVVVICTIIFIWFFLTPAKKPTYKHKPEPKTERLIESATCPPIPQVSTKSTDWAEIPLESNRLEDDIEENSSSNRKLTNLVCRMGMHRRGRKSSVPDSDDPGAVRQYLDNIDTHISEQYDTGNARDVMQ
jgi:hypothetical protein